MNLKSPRLPIWKAFRRGDTLALERIGVSQVEGTHEQEQRHEAGSICYKHVGIGVQSTRMGVMR